MLRYAISDLGHRAQQTASESPQTTSNHQPERLRRCVAWATKQASAGVDFLLIREKYLGAAELLELARHTLAAIRSTGAATRLLVHSRADLALAAGADGVHLASGVEALRPAQVRAVLDLAELPGRAQAVVSVSCHTLEEVATASREGADLILFGPVFGKTIAGVEIVPAVGLESLHTACRAARATPVLALGGVTSGNAPACVEAGAAGIAGIRLFG